ncbi:hypothetical protein X801_00030, partial [Opisthorchis viverrini]
MSMIPVWSMSAGTVLSVRASPTRSWMRHRVTVKVRIRATSRKVPFRMKVTTIAFTQVSRWVQLFGPNFKAGKYAEFDPITRIATHYYVVFLDPTHSTISRIRAGRLRRYVSGSVQQMKN